jgi:hypothetical protein
MHKQKPKKQENCREKQMLSLQNGQSKGLYEILPSKQKDTKKFAAAGGDN